jgi:hypothetical protein
MDAKVALRDFLSAFASQVSLGLPTEGLAERQWLTRHDEGSLFLDSSDQRKVAILVDQLLKEYSPRDQLSRREVERIVHQAIFAAVDISKKRQGELSARLAAAVGDAIEALRKSPESQDWWLPVRGLEHSTLPHVFGGCEFLLLDAAVEEAFRELAARRRPAAELTGLDRLFEWARKSPGWQREVVKITVAAVDLDAGAELATRSATELVDVLNYFGDLIPNQHGRAYLPGWATPERTVSLGLTARGGITSPHARVGPLLPLSFAVLRQAEFLRDALAAAESILAGSGGRSGFDETTVAAMAWAGRATIARGMEEAFLLHAIALEALLLPEGNKQELAYRLGLRAAFFLADNSEGRRTIQRKVRDLYGIRSAIVHSGAYRVSAQDLQSIRILATRCIFQSLVTPGLRDGLSKKDAGQWIEDQITR